MSVAIVRLQRGSNVLTNNNPNSNTANHGVYGFGGNYPSNGNSGHGMGGIMRGCGMGMTR
ncbi:MAG: hypothetical protein ACLQO7_00985 [Candidatus Bathyarchaeia archaeon]